MNKQLFCTECGRTHLLSDCVTRPFFNDGLSYFCPNTEDSKEIARSSGDRFVVWNGREFK